MNKVFLVGRLVQDVELRTTAGGSSVCELRIAVPQHERDKSYYFTVVAWQKLAELCSNYLVKGQRLAVVGELQSRTYEAKDGTKRTVCEIRADEIEFLDKPQTVPQLDFTTCEEDDLPFG